MESFDPARYRQLITHTFNEMSSSSEGGKNVTERGLDNLLSQEDIGQRLLEAAREMNANQISLLLPQCDQKDHWQAACRMLIEESLAHRIHKTVDAGVLKSTTIIQPLHIQYNIDCFKKCVQLFVNDLRDHAKIPIGKIGKNISYCNFSGIRPWYELRKAIMDNDQRVDHWFEGNRDTAICHLVDIGNLRQLDRIIEHKASINGAFGMIFVCMINLCVTQEKCFEDAFRLRFYRMFRTSQEQNIDLIFLSVLLVQAEKCALDPDRIKGFSRIVGVLVRAFIGAHSSFMHTIQTQAMDGAREIVRANILPVEEAQLMFLPFVMPATSKHFRMVKKTIRLIKATKSKVESEVGVSSWSLRCGRCIVALRELRDHFKEHEKFDPASIDPAELEPGNIA